MSRPCKNSPDCANGAASDRTECEPCRHVRRTALKRAVKAGKPVRVLLIDIETSPLKAYTWGMFDQNIGLNQLIEPTRMMCFAAKWLGDPKSKTMFFSEHSHGQADMVAQAHALLDEADAVMHFNGKSFDAKHLSREFLEAGMGPPSPYAQIDLLLVARKNFRFPSNKLQYISTALGLEGKAEHEGFGLWVKCMAGDDAAWKRMERYNKQDVILLEELYHRLLPWLSTSHPNLRLYGSSTGCPSCGSESLQRRGLARTRLSTFQQFRCNDCGSYFRSSKRVAGTDLQAVAL